MLIMLHPFADRFWDVSDISVPDATEAKGHSVQHRLTKATAAFYADLDIYGNKDISIKCKFERFAKRILPILTHVCGGWGVGG